MAVEVDDRSYNKQCEQQGSAADRSTKANPRTRFGQHSGQVIKVSRDGLEESLGSRQSPFVSLNIFKAIIAY